MDNRVNANKGVVSKNLVYGRVFMAGNRTEYPGTDNTYKKLKNKISYGRRKKSYGSKGKSRIEGNN